MGKWTPTRTPLYIDGKDRTDLKDDLQWTIMQILEHGPASTWGIHFTLGIGIEASARLLEDLHEYEYIYQEWNGLWFIKDWRKAVILRKETCLTCGSPMPNVIVPEQNGETRMTGFLENLNDQVAKLTAEVASIKAHLNGALAAPAATAALPTVAAATPAAADPFAGLGATATPAAAPATVTDEMVMKLVTDNVANEQIKAGMQQVLAQMGIARLPDTRPDQLPELYQRLSAVVAQNAAVAAQPALPAATAPASIL